MAKTINWEGRIGRRLRLRDLHVFFTVLQHRSMAKAAQELGVTQPAVSRAIADLEHTLGVLLLDRSPRGVEPTIYGRALLKRGNAAFDELRQGVRDIEFLTDPTVGEVRIGCQETIAAAILPPVMQHFSREYPRVVLYVEQLSWSASSLDLPSLSDRGLDLVIVRSEKPRADKKLPDELHAETLFHDQLVVAAGRQTHWARRRKIDIAELINEPWILPYPNSWNYAELAEAFQSRGLDMPRLRSVALSTHIRINLLAAGPHITTFANSVMGLYADRFSLKALPVDLPIRPWPVLMVTVKNRTLSPVVELFIEHLRDFTRSVGAEQ